MSYCASSAFSSIRKAKRNQLPPAFQVQLPATLASSRWKIYMQQIHYFLSLKLKFNAIPSYPKFQILNIKFTGSWT